MTNDPDSSVPTDSPGSELSELRSRIAALTQTLDQQTQQINELRDENNLLQVVINHMPYAIYWKDSALVYRGCNQSFATDLGLPNPAAVVGKRDIDLAWQPQEIATFEAIDRRIMETRTTEYDDDETVIHPNGRQEWFETYKIPLIGDTGAAEGILATYRNITKRKEAELTVMAQATLLEELSTPAIPITDRILVLPLIGSIDSRRAQQILETVLERLAESGAEIVLLDITGVPLIDTQVAHALIQTSQAVQLLGARLILTGIRPEVAQALVGLGVQLGGMITYSTLQRALAEVYRQQ
jgi:rsbT co-antagonist protein RsbR